MQRMTLARAPGLVNQGLLSFQGFLLRLLRHDEVGLFAGLHALHDDLQV